MALHFAERFSLSRTPQCRAVSGVGACLLIVLNADCKRLVLALVSVYLSERDEFLVPVVGFFSCLWP